ncbi:hypothetical protein GLS_c18680 [Gluconobacter oxydans DSM 3504]|uniref:Uncharacterized protein n=1 Tax=Gluconobacter oxydans DSM 3504 TaxID=1288313 RepID=A0A067Z6H1_GLUOY|nr:hypothetical protein GLS_c18680 [Gluconobacter oxydans DSM 3504]
MLPATGSAFFCGYAGITKSGNIKLCTARIPPQMRLRRANTSRASSFRDKASWKGEH